MDLTSDGRERVGRLYGPLAAEGSRLLARFSDGELAMIRDFLGEATDLVDRHTGSLRRELAGGGAHGPPTASGS